MAFTIHTNSVHAELEAELKVSLPGNLNPVKSLQVQRC